MTISDALIIIAVILGPILAVQVQKFIENSKQRKERKISIFKTLMATRGTPLSPLHVEALNMIDLEFSGKDLKEKAVLDSWKLYHDHLYEAPKNIQEPTYQSKLDTWATKKTELLIDLLYSMSIALEYAFDKVQLKRGAYTPKGYADLEIQNSLLRQGILEVLSRKQPLTVKVVP
jgi:hypothetical protein